MGKNFALRSGEYTPKTKVPTLTTLKWKSLNFHFFKKVIHASLTLKITKTNKTYKTEIVTRKCLCDIPKLKTICAVCALLQYKKISKILFGNNIEENYLFVHQNGELVTFNEYNKEFKEALFDIGIKAISPYWRPHSLRAGEISDLIASGVSLALVQKYARHVPGSKSTTVYITLETDEEANLINNLYKTYFS